MTPKAGPELSELTQVQEEKFEAGRSERQGQMHKRVDSKRAQALHRAQTGVYEAGRHDLQSQMHGRLAAKALASKTPAGVPVAMSEEAFTRLRSEETLGEKETQKQFDEQKEAQEREVQERAAHEQIIKRDASMLERLQSMKRTKDDFQGVDSWSTITDNTRPIPAPVVRRSGSVSRIGSVSRTNRNIPPVGKLDLVGQGAQLQHIIQDLKQDSNRAMLQGMHVKRKLELAAHVPEDVDALALREHQDSPAFLRRPLQLDELEETVREPTQAPDDFEPEGEEVKTEVETEYPGIGITHFLPDTDERPEAVKPLVPETPLNVPVEMSDEAFARMKLETTPAFGYAHDTEEQSTSFQAIEEQFSRIRSKSEQHEKTIDTVGALLEESPVVTPEGSEHGAVHIFSPSRAKELGLSPNLARTRLEPEAMTKSQVNLQDLINTKQAELDKFIKEHPEAHQEIEQKQEDLSRSRRQFQDLGAPTRMYQGTVDEMEPRHEAPPTSPETRQAGPTVHFDEDYERSPSRGLSIPFHPAVPQRSRTRSRSPERGLQDRPTEPPPDSSNQQKFDFYSELVREILRDHEHPLRGQLNEFEDAKQHWQKQWDREQPESEGSERIDIVRDEPEDPRTRRKKDLDKMLQKMGLHALSKGTTAPRPRHDILVPPMPNRSIVVPGSSGKDKGAIHVQKVTVKQEVGPKKKKRRKTKDGVVKKRKEYNALKRKTIAAIRAGRRQAYNQESAKIKKLPVKERKSARAKLKEELKKREKSLLAKLPSVAKMKFSDVNKLIISIQKTKW